MHAVIFAAQRLLAHWQAIAAMLTALASLVGTIKNVFDDGKHAKAEKALDKVLDVLAFVSKYGAKGLPYLGRLSIPGLPSRPANPPPGLKLVPPDEEKKS